MHSEGLAFMMLLEMQKKHRDPAVHQRAELMAARRARRRTAGRLRRWSASRGGDS
jgi:hypothetical protein